MRLFIPDIKYEFKAGGPKTFLLNLKNFLKDKNIILADSIKNSSIIFFPISYKREELVEAQLRGSKIIQRLDGIYYFSKYGLRYRLLNHEIKNIYLKFSDHVIFQSDYSRKQCFHMFGAKDKKEYSIVFNGARRDIFYPQEESNCFDKNKVVNFITTGNFRSEDMVRPMVQALDSLIEDFNFKLTIIGPVRKELKKYLDRPYVDYVENKSLKELAAFLRNHDIFIFTQLNPPCPNSVIEAASCGLPIIGFKSGSMEELLPFSKDLLAYVSDELFQKDKDLDDRKLAQKILKCVDNYQYYKQLALDNSTKYSFERCGDEYLKIFDKVSEDSKLIYLTIPAKIFILFSRIFFSFYRMIFRIVRIIYNIFKKIL